MRANRAVRKMHDGKGNSRVTYWPDPAQPMSKVLERERTGSFEMIVFADRVVVPSHVLVRNLDGETVLLNVETEKYFGLDRTGTQMWEKVTRAANVEEAFEALTSEFEVEPETLREHLTNLLGQLVENGLLQVVPADVESIPAI
jgi:Coenzyme PQQ synthesis protein D (PqqD)